MTDKRWRVVCDNFVSVEFDNKADAKIHANETRLRGSCRLEHEVIYTDLDYGSRTKGKAAS